MDNYDEILGLLFPDIDKYFSIGGGMMADARKKRLDQSKTRRFKPAVLFQEPVKIDPGETVITPFTMPNYVGQYVSWSLVRLGTVISRLKKRYRLNNRSHYSPRFLVWCDREILLHYLFLYLPLMRR